MNQNINFHVSKEDNALLVVDILAKKSNLSKSLIKKLMVYGAIHQTIKGKRKRVRKAKSIAREGHLIECFYDPDLDLNIDFKFRAIYQNKYYGIYHKPMGAMTEGNDYGDKASLLRSVEKVKRFAYVVNRLDIHTEGLVVIAYDPKLKIFFNRCGEIRLLKNIKRSFSVNSKA